MRRLAIFTIIGILALAGCSGFGGSGGSGESSPTIYPTAESGERSFLAEPGKAKDDTKTQETKTPKANPGPTPITIAGPGICGRTPEIQNTLINDLNIRILQGDQQRRTLPSQGNILQTRRASNQET